MSKISVIIPAFNEENSVEKTLKALTDVCESLSVGTEIILVDDGSKDRTVELASKFKNVKVISHKRNKGYGASLKTGIKNAAGDLILITDCDSTYPIESIPSLVKYADDYDMVVGARTGKIVKVPFLRKPAKFFLKLLVNYLSGSKVPDFNSGLRIFKKDLALRFFGLFPDGFSFTTTITIAAMSNGYDVKWVPINYFKRVGKSTMKPLKDFMNFIQLIIRLVLYFKPLNIFIPASFLIFLAGAIKLGFDFVSFNRFGIGGALLILTSVQLFFLGLLADLIIKRTQL